MRWTRGAQSQADAIKTARSARAVRDEAHASEIKAKLEQGPVDVKVKAGQGGRLFGAVTVGDVAEALGEVAGEPIDKRTIILGNPIKTLGAHPVSIKLHDDVSAAVALNVIPALTLRSHPSNGRSRSGAGRSHFRAGSSPISCMSSSTGSLARPAARPGAGRWPACGGDATTPRRRDRRRRHPRRAVTRPATTQRTSTTSDWRPAVRATATSTTCRRCRRGVRRARRPPDGGRPRSACRSVRSPTLGARRHVASGDLVVAERRTATARPQDLRRGPAGGSPGADDFTGRLHRAAEPPASVASTVDAGRRPSATRRGLGGRRCSPPCEATLRVVHRRLQLRHRARVRGRRRLRGRPEASRASRWPRSRWRRWAA